MNRKIRVILVATVTSVVLTGCGANSFENPIVTDTITVVETKPVVQVAETIPIESSTPDSFKYGDEVWYVIHYEDGFRAQFFDATVIEELDGYLLVTRDGHDEYVEWEIPLNDCYRTRAEAQAVADAENEVYAHDDYCS